jgi:Cu(I)/Ag(I) efflux system protein CusF
MMRAMDLRTTSLGLILAFGAGCHGGAPKEADHPRPATDARAAASAAPATPRPSPKDYDIKGRITAVDAPGSQVTINHSEIKGLMAAMEMTYRVGDPQLLQGLKAGDEVEGTLEVGGDYVITKLKKR